MKEKKSIEEYPILHQSIIKSFTKARSCPTVVPVRIKVNGVFIKTYNGKTIWEGMAGARTALVNHFKNWAEKNCNAVGMPVLGYRPLQSLQEIMINDGTIEFVPVKKQRKI